MPRAEEESEYEEVVRLGGLHIIGTERHEARRIDNQLRGRGGRQGDPGSSQFFVSLEDDLMRIFGSDRIKRMMEVLKVPEDQPIENGMLSRAIESAQGKIEGFHFDTRKHVLEYDDVMNKQRQRIYSWRKKVLEFNAPHPPLKIRGGEEETPSLDSREGWGEFNLRQEILKSVEKEIHGIVEFGTAGDISEWNIKEIYDAANAIFPLPNDAQEKIKEFKDKEDLINYFSDAAKNDYELKENEVGPEAMRQIEKILMLRTIDMLWMDHLDDMDHLRDSVRLRAYGQKDPLVEYKNEGHKLFYELLAAIDSQVVKMIYKVSLAKEPSTDYRPRTMAGNRAATDYRSPAIARINESTFGASQAADRSPSPVSGRNIGRNDPCWCGSGKKYKKCHGS